MDEPSQKAASSQWTLNSILALGPDGRPDGLLRHVLESLPYPFLVIRTVDFAIVAANAAARVGQADGSSTCYALSHGRSTPCTAPEDTCPLAAVRETKRPIVIEHQHIGADGHPRPVEVHAYPVIDEQGGVVAIIEYAIDISARRQAEEVLRKLSRAVEQSPSTVAITDLDGNLEYVNPKFTELTGYSAAEAVGQNPRILNARVQPPQVFEDMWRILREGGEWRGEFCNRRKDGSLYWELASISPVRDAQGTITHYIKVAEDITARREAEEALRQRTLELQARNEELDAFAHTVAHDLKNPLTSVGGYAEILEGYAAQLSEAQRQEYLHAISQNVRKMARIIQELLLLASVRREDVPRQPVDMARVVGEVRGRLGDMVVAAAAQVDAPQEWPTALGYGPWVEEVWTNYLSNAIKYGGQPPHVTLGATLQDDGFIRFWVRDNGPGLDSEEQSRLFAPFSRLDKVRAEGHGLGLSIVRRIVERLGGQVGVESVPAQGSTFYFTLPAAGDGAGP